MQEKRCSKCRIIKSLSEFHKNCTRKDGLSSQCKSCVSERQKQYYDKNRDIIVEQQRDYDNKNRERIREYQRLNLKKREEKHPLRMKARMTFKNAILKGEIKRPSICENCGEETGEPIEGHHEDYSKPFDVVWLCLSCHREIHREKNRIMSST